MTLAADRLLFLIKRRGPSTAADLAAALEVSPQSVREQLAGLLEQALVSFEDVATGRGRPRRHWALTEAAQGRFPDTHAELTVDLIGLIRDQLGEAALDRVLTQRERRGLAHYQNHLAGIPDLAGRVSKLAELRSVEGYMAEAVPTDDGDGWLLIEHHCPICAAARVCQGFCRAELEVFRTVLGPNATVSRSEHLLAGGRRCVYRVQPVDS